MRKFSCVAATLLLCAAAALAADPATQDARFEAARTEFQQGDKAHAAELLRELAEEGHRYAMFTLGAMYHNGMGVEQSYDEAFGWYRKAADLGSAEAQVNLGLFYFYGVSVETDPVEAYKWFLLGVEGGAENAQMNLEKLGREMSRQQLDEAARLAREWKQKFYGKPAP